MAENTKIEWAHHTFNPWIGCTKVGPGCDHCYAEADFDKRRHVVQWGAGQPRKHTASSTWHLPVKWNAEAERLGVRYRVFCASLGDVFDNEVRPAWRSELFQLIKETPNLDWLLLTKRIGNAKTMMADALHLNPAALSDGRIWPLPNVWIGATITSQSEADRDIPKLLAVPAAVRFLSMEPLLGPVDLTDICNTRGEEHEDHFSALFDPDDDVDEDGNSFPYIDWVIVGGESGPKARPMHPQWARDLRDQCAEAGVPFLFKQHGEWIGVPDLRNLPGGAGPGFGSFDHRTHDQAHDAVRIGKKAAGRLLDGVQHDGYPEAPNA